MIYLNKCLANKILESKICISSQQEINFIKNLQIEKVMIFRGHIPNIKGKIQQSKQTL